MNSLDGSNNVNGTFNSLIMSFYLIELPVMIFNKCFIFNPYFHPKTLVLSQLLQTSLSLGVGRVALVVLLFPGLNRSCEDIVQS